MNLTERKMVDVLKDLRENFHVVGIKAEFEAEGTRLEEALRLKEVCMKAELGLTIKIGGCEALRDMYECRVIGVERMVAPMVESAYSLEKFLDAAKMAFPEDERKDIVFAVNVETISACRAFDEMLALPTIGLLGGVVMGRVDLTGSMKVGRDAVNSPEVFEITRDLLCKAKTKSLETAIGGGVSAFAAVLPQPACRRPRPLRNAQSHLRLSRRTGDRRRQGDPQGRRLRTAVAEEQAGLLQGHFGGRRPAHRNAGVALSPLDRSGGRQDRVGAVAAQRPANGTRGFPR